MKYELSVTQQNDKHIYFKVLIPPDDADHGTPDQLIYEANLNRRLLIRNEFKGNYRIARKRWDKFQSYIRGVNKLNRFRY